MDASQEKPLKTVRHLILVSVMIFPYFSFAKLAKSRDLKQLEVHGFLVKDGDRAVVTQGQKKYSMPWMKFARMNNVAADHETRQTKYMLPFDQDLKIELD